MTHKQLKTLICCALIVIQWMLPSTASAVGGGVPFFFVETLVPNAFANVVPADSMDFTYHACVHFINNTNLTESGFLWISSFQDVDSVVDSQINHFAANGYHLYARYDVQANECVPSPQPTCNGLGRRNYQVVGASLTLFLDPMQDTQLSLQNCGVGIGNNGDDVMLGTANAIISGQKTETNDQANGDFDIVFANWMFSAAGQNLYVDGNANPLASQVLVFNANVTDLGGTLNNDHRPEGSGNLFWD